jgi:hypothetical protein
MNKSFTVERKQKDVHEHPQRGRLFNQVYLLFQLLKERNRL